MLIQLATNGVFVYKVLSAERALVPPKVPAFVTTSVIASATLFPEDRHRWRIPRCL